MKRRIACILLTGWLLVGGLVVWNLKAEDFLAIDRISGQDEVAVFVDHRGRRIEPAPDPAIVKLRQQYVQLAKAHADMMNDPEELEKAILRLEEEVKRLRSMKQVRSVRDTLKELRYSNPGTEIERAASQALDALKNLDTTAPE